MIASALFTTAGLVTIPTLIIGRGRSVADVRVTTWMGGHIISLEVEYMTKVTEGSGAIAEVRVMGPAATKEITAGTGVNAGDKVIQPNPPNPRMDSDRSAVSRPNVVEVGQYK